MTDTAQPNDGINLTEQRLTPEARAALYPFLNRVPAPRPIPTTAARLADARACGHTPEQHRHLDGQEADDRSHARAIRELETELERATNQRDAAWKGNAQLAAERDRFARDHASAEQVATFRQGVIDLHGAELGAAGEVIAVVRDAQEQIERALARYDTTPNQWRHHPCGLTTTLPDGDRPTGGWCDRCQNDLGTDSWVAVTPGLGSVSPRAQDADLEPWIRRAAADPGSIAGHRRGPSWGEGEEGYAEEQETVPAWIARAVLRVLAKDGQPHCERCSQVIRVNDMYDPPLPGIGLWEHKGDCPPVEARS